MNKKLITFNFGAIILVAVLAFLDGCGSSHSREEDAGEVPADASMDGDAGEPASDGGSDSGLAIDAGPIATDAGEADASAPDAGPECPTPYEGDLITGTGPATYYIATDGNRYVFPNEREYFTWYIDFSGVRTVSDAYIATIPIHGNVRVRPGTHLVKITTDPRVYAVSPCGVLRWIENETLAIELYGSDWAARVVDIPDSFFVNYTIGASISTPVHPDGQLIRYPGETTVYLMEAGERRRVSLRALEDSGFREEFVVETTIEYPDGAPYDCAEPLYQETICASCGCSTP